MGVPPCCQCNYSQTVKMRYQSEIEVLKVPEKFGSKKIGPSGPELI